MPMRVANAELVDKVGGSRTQVTPLISMEMKISGVANGGGKGG